MSNRRPIPTLPGSRRGSVYIFALMVSMVVTAIGVGAALSAQSELAAAEMRVRGIEARVGAQSALELGLARASNTLAWRSGAFAEAAGFVDTTLNGVRLVVQVDDGAGGEPRADIAYPFRLRATASVGAARHGLEGTFTPVLVPAGALRGVAYAGRNLSFLLGASVKSGDTVGANNSVSALGASVGPNAYSAGSITGVTYGGATSQNRAALTMPDPALVDHYIALGTKGTVSGAQNGHLYSPMSNPDGAPNAGGVYVLDCGGQAITIRNSRVYGTLVILDPGSGSSIDKSNIFEPIAPGQPSLIVRGSIWINQDTADLAESSTNMNPAGAPYQGVVDSDTSDSYASMFGGIVYATGSITITGSFVLEGALVAGNDVIFGLGAKAVLQRVLPATLPSAFSVTERFDLDQATFARITY